MAKKFSPREVKVFSELLSLGYTQRNIATLAGVSQPTISRILRSEAPNEVSKRTTSTMKEEKNNG